MQRFYEDIGLLVSKVLLPKKDIDYKKWSVIACDQYTSQLDYWKKVKEIVSDNPSTLKIIYPEVYLDSENKNQIIENINKKMQEYLEKDIFNEYQNLIFVQRDTKKNTRNGIVLAIDLEKYNYSKDSDSLIRATEKTIVSRLPPRMDIRRNATLETPHIMILIDDPKKQIIEPLENKKQNLEKLYDFDLMLDSGHLKGYKIDIDTEKEIVSKLRELKDYDNFKQKYNLKKDYPVLLYAMGDGNHSLAAAKEIWEETKKNSNSLEEIKDHPSRFALVEMVNIHDNSLVFESIYRVLFNLNEDILNFFKKTFKDDFEFKEKQKQEIIKEVDENNNENLHKFGFFTDSKTGVIIIKNSKFNLDYKTLQNTIDSYLENNPSSKIDYIHGKDVLFDLSKKQNSCGFYLSSIDKSDLFKSVIIDGVLPRKSFSMGEAYEKRFYMEARKIK